MAATSAEATPTTTSANLITDPFLLDILQTSSNARLASLTALSLLSTSSSPSDSSTDSHGGPPTSPLHTQTTQQSSLSSLSSSSSSEQLDAQRKLLHTYLSSLRGQNRRLAHLVRNNKATTAVSRSEIDALHLSLQNLHYESRHLEGEISACERFPHTYTSLPLVAEHDFLERFPEWRAAAAAADEDALMKARIQAEYTDRVALEEQRKKLLARKVELVRQNAKRKEELGKLDQDLEKFVEAATPILKTFEKEY